MKDRGQAKGRDRFSPGEAGAFFPGEAGAGFYGKMVYQGGLLDFYSLKLQTGPFYFVKGRLILPEAAFIMLVAYDVLSEPGHRARTR
jgi:hypothetical protein